MKTSARTKVILSDDLELYFFVNISEVFDCSNKNRSRFGEMAQQFLSSVRGPGLVPSISYGGLPPSIPALAEMPPSDFLGYKAHTVHINMYVQAEYSYA